MQEALNQSREVAQSKIKENARFRYNTREMSLQYDNSLLSEAITGGLDTVNSEDEEIARLLAEEIGGEEEGESEIGKEEALRMIRDVGEEE